MPIRNITRSDHVIGSATPGNAPIYVDSDDNRLKLIPAGSGTTEVVLQEANGAAQSEVVVTTNVLTAAESGKTLFLALVGGFTTTLPAPVLGLNFKFYVQIAPTTAYIVRAVDTAGVLATIMAGQVYASSGGNEDSQTTFGASDVTFVANTSVIGDSAELFSDGTNWYARAYTNAAGGITLD